MTIIVTKPGIIIDVVGSYFYDKKSCSCISGPPRTKSPFSVMIFVIEVGPTTSMMIPGFVTIIVIVVSYV